MELLVCRHGETRHNKEGVVQGQMDFRLNGKGREQAEKLRDRLEEENVDTVYSSTMTRAVETAEIVSERQEAGIEKRDELNEVARAEFEGENFEDLIEEISDSEKEDYLWSPENGESLEELKQRATGFFNSLAEKHQEEKVLVVSHGGTISATLMGVLEHSAKNCYRIEQDNCCINRMVWNQENGWRIESVNDTCHLED